MLFKFQQASCVLVGTFNIYIIQPQLLAEMGVIEEFQKFRIAGDLSQPGVRLLTPEMETIWTVRPERLEIETRQKDVDCGAPAAKLLKALCWTPVKAVGINASFSAPPAMASHLPEHFRVPEVDGAFWPTCQVTYREQEANINITCIKKEDELSIAINLHSDFGHIDNQQEACKRATERCIQFKESIRDAVAKAAKLTGGDIDYAN